MLTVWPDSPQRHGGGEDRERNVDDHHEGAAPIPQEQQHHQAGEERAERPSSVKARIARVT